MPDLTPPDEPIADDHLERLLADHQAPDVPFQALLQATLDLPGTGGNEIARSWVAGIPTTLFELLHQRALDIGSEPSHG